MLYYELMYICRLCCNKFLLGVGITGFLVIMSAYKIIKHDSSKQHAGKR